MSGSSCGNVLQESGSSDEGTNGTLDIKTGRGAARAGAIRIRAGLTNGPIGADVIVNGGRSLGPDSVGGAIAITSGAARGDRATTGAVTVGSAAGNTGREGANTGAVKVMSGETAATGKSSGAQSALVLANPKHGQVTYASLSAQRPALGPAAATCF